MKADDLYKLLTEEEKLKLKTALKGEFTLCEIKGHNYRYIGKKYFLLWGWKDKFVCARCGHTMYN